MPTLLGEQFSSFLPWHQSLRSFSSAPRLPCILVLLPVPSPLRGPKQTHLPFILQRPTSRAHSFWLLAVEGFLLSPARLLLELSLCDALHPGEADRLAFPLLSQCLFPVRPLPHSSALHTCWLLSSSRFEVKSTVLKGCGLHCGHTAKSTVDPLICPPCSSPSDGLSLAGSKAAVREKPGCPGLRAGHKGVLQDTC